MIRKLTPEERRMRRRARGVIRRLNKVFTMMYIASPERRLKKACVLIRRAQKLDANLRAHVKEFPAASVFKDELWDLAEALERAEEARERFRDRVNR
jgi:hypothetical protein